jgi:hypothetical protein
MHEKPLVVTITIPTELSRGDPFGDLIILVVSLLGTWYAFNMGHVWWAVPVLLIVTPEVLSGEPAADVGFIGAVAAGFRSRLGLRRAHEWIQAWAHYFRIRQWPDFQRWSHDTSRRMYVAVRRVRAVRWAVDRLVPVVQGAHARVRLPRRLTHRFRREVAALPEL